MSNLYQRLKDWERRVSWSFGDDISTPEKRREAWRHFNLVDHAFLRVLWTNLAQVAPGCWRSNQPSPKRIARYKKMGIKTIISLRGNSRWSYNLFEEEACAEHGITFCTERLAARSLVKREQVLSLLDRFEQVEQPVLIHCKSGADRAGLASALWLLHMEGADMAAAKKQFSLRFIHLSNTRTGILDFMLEAIEADAHLGLTVREWVETRYDPQHLTQAWKRARGRT